MLRHLTVPCGPLSVPWGPLSVTLKSLTVLWCFEYVKNALERESILLTTMEFVTTIQGACSLLHQGYKYTLNRRNASGQIYWRCHDRSCPGTAVSKFFQYFEATWLHGAFPVHMWNVQYLNGPCANNHAEGWHSKVSWLGRHILIYMRQWVSFRLNKQPLKSA